ncbi:MAG: hypothetical protein CMH57_14225 [Myxococcales bacterium]|nr:hypothetical protein [Myxococcales bacterium]
MKKLGFWLKRVSAVVLVVVALVAAGVWLAVTQVPYPRAWLQDGGVGSVRLVDREGAPLRDVVDRHGGRSVWVEREAISDWLVRATLASEDHRFLVHPGVDPWAIVRATWLNLSLGRVYSGASTLTMQLVRMTDPAPRPKTLLAKAREALLALRLEQALSKEEILVQYLNRAPYGNGTHGVEAASRLYLGKPASALSPAEAAFLAALPRSPTGYNPYRRYDRAIRRQRHILGLMQKHGHLHEEGYAEALSARLGVQRRRYPFEAPHVVDYALRRADELWSERPSEVELTVDLSLQRRAQGVVERHLAALEGSGVEQAAVVVLDNATGELLTMIGSRSWYDRSSRGQFNGATARRHPGMTLAPLLYAAAFEAGVTPAQVVPDVPTRVRLQPGELSWVSNDDGRFRGPVRLREALASGRRVPTLRLLRELNGERLREQLAEMELTSFPSSWSSWGPSLMAREARVSLLELTSAYAALARGGVWRRPEVVRAVRTRQGRREVWRPGSRDIFGADQAALVTDILSDETLRESHQGPDSPLLLGYPVAALTTSEGVNGDFWTIGYSSEVTVGVWMGRFDGRPLGELTGLVDAAPLFRDVMELAMGDREPGLFPEPEFEAVSVCALSGHRAGPSCPHATEERFTPGEVPEHTCDWHVSIAIDQRNGFRAGPGCEEEAVQWHTYVALPDAYRSWAARRGLVSLSESMSPDCRVTGERPVQTPGLGASLLVREPLLSAPVAGRHDTRRQVGLSGRARRETVATDKQALELLGELRPAPERL